MTLVDVALRAPSAAATFLLARAEGLDLDELADPATVTALAATAVGSLNPWADASSLLRERALVDVRPLQSFIDEVLADPRNKWWFAPIDRAQQVVLVDEEQRIREVEAPTGPATAWESYAQRRQGLLESATLLPVTAQEPIRSGLHAELAYMGTDWRPRYPLYEARLLVEPAARVYEIAGPEDWNTLVSRYRDLKECCQHAAHLQGASGITSGPAPVWSLVAQDWDGIHLSFFGFLTSLYTPWTTDETTTTLWTWMSERTHWLRQCFAEVTPLPALQGPIIAPRFHWRWW